MSALESMCLVFLILSLFLIRLFRNLKKSKEEKFRNQELREKWFAKHPFMNLFRKGFFLFLLLGSIANVVLQSRDMRESAYCLRRYAGEVVVLNEQITSDGVLTFEIFNGRINPVFVNTHSGETETLCIEVFENNEWHDSGLQIIRDCKEKIERRYYLKFNIPQIILKWRVRIQWKDTESADTGFLYTKTFTESGESE